MATYKFGPHIIPSSQVFLLSKQCFGFVNLKPVVAGHVLLTPFRVVKRYSDLNSEEVCDLFLSAQKVGKVIEREYKGTSLTFVIQDGPEAGQTVPHFHLHVIPRKVGDWVVNDDVYKEINKSSRVDDEERPPRSIEEMAKEAEFLRQFFSNSNEN
ncbi:bis(5'-adenosyl)-triphosphatase isoform X1 [Rhizophagus clarus]|uniref:Bis(5'-adenosyl)-triphosphatase n=1 Tax=Rhizophagus clarus TaxID=94130 RepID=A0A8H3MDL2_9GLOM|nr:bis(5'-adenosyl)-triphosphatase isoform X1 [Rhizophagus clarus]